MDVGRVDGTEDGFWSEKGRWTDSVWKVWKDVRAGKGDEGLVGGGAVVVVVVVVGRRVVEVLASSSITRFSIGFGKSLASGPLPCTRSRSMGSWWIIIVNIYLVKGKFHFTWLYLNSSGE